MSRKLSFQLLLVSMILFPITSFATHDRYAGHRHMNGFSLKDFGRFYKNWKLVTVRYREDVKEMRFVYANSLALKTLKSGKTDYPDGSVFAKIGFLGQKDPAFASSVVPSGAKRYQFMVRDKKKFAATDGWGFVIFNGEGLTFKGNPHQIELACAACHRLVHQRGDVYSQLAAFSPFVEKEKPIGAAKIGVIDTGVRRLKFRLTSWTALPPELKRLIPQRDKNVFELTGAIEKYIFEGTVNEIGPILAKKTVATGRPAYLSSKDGHLFAFSYLDPAGRACKAPKARRTVVGRSITPNHRTDANEAIVRETSYCETAGPR